MKDSSAFHEFYRNQWGDRWPHLWEALHQKETQVARINAFDPPPIGDDAPNPAAIPRGKKGLLSIYYMDPGSIVIAQALGVEPGQQVLDLCAAPGGKSLILIEASGGEGNVVLNEFSQARRARLRKVIQQYVPRDVRERVVITGQDGGLLAKRHSCSFDRVLVDAPCSGERHLIHSPQRLKEWTPAQAKRLSQRQYGLLAGGFEAAKPGGRIVYSTCTLSKLENEGVVARLLEKKKDRVRLIRGEDPAGSESADFGFHILPDHSQGSGPFFCAILEKWS
ncbi:MAG: hypothetical protein C5B49_09085 [Bdellovibrio sp.]|nr:MAG: hypothetical protein C5B49_09085 [Bdellovibrio sp.]